MEADLATLIQQVQQGDTDAYEPIVRRFQDIAVGYGYARLGEVQLAEDAASSALPLLPRSNFTKQLSPLHS